MCNINCFYVVDSNVKLNDTHRTNFCVSLATVVMRTRHIVRLCVHCLSCHIYRHGRGLHKVVVYNHRSAARCICVVVLFSLLIQPYVGRCLEKRLHALHTSTCAKSDFRFFLTQNQCWPICGPRGKHLRPLVT